MRTNLARSDEHFSQWVHPGENAFHLHSLGVLQLYSSPLGLASWTSSLGKIESKTVFLSDLADAHFALECLLPITLQLEPSQVIAYSYDLDELAVGSDESSALEEMRLMIAESYRLLKAERNNLGPLQQRHWNLLSKVIREI